MKYGIIILTFYLVGCSFNDENLYTEFLNSDKDTTLVTEFSRFVSDTTVEKIYLRTREKKYDDKTAIGYVFFNRAGVPLLSGTEYFYSDNSFYLAASSIYELDSLGNSIEIKGKIIRGGRQLYDDIPIRYTVDYKVKVDTAMSLRVITEIVPQVEYIDSLKDNCLLVKSIEKSYRTFSDNRSDITTIAKATRFYIKTKGLVRIESDVNGTKSTYILTNKFYHR